MTLDKVSDDIDAPVTKYLRCFLNVSVFFVWLPTFLYLIAASIGGLINEGRIAVFALFLEHTLPLIAIGIGGYYYAYRKNVKCPSFLGKLASVFGFFYMFVITLVIGLHVCNKITAADGNGPGLHSVLQEFLSYFGPFQALVTSFFLLLVGQMEIKSFVGKGRDFSRGPAPGGEETAGNTADDDTQKGE